MSDNEQVGAGAPSGTDPAVAVLREEIAHTRAEMSANIGALEHQLAPSELREKALIELGHVEAKVKEVVREQIAEAKEVVREQIAEAKVVVREQLAEAGTLLRKEFEHVRETVMADLVVGKEHVKHELAVAFQGAKKSVRDATLGKVEDLTTKAGDVMNEARDTLVDTVRQNPLPAALAGIGLAWLLMNRSNSASRRRSGGPLPHASERGHDDYRIGVSRAGHSVEGRAGQVVSQVGSTLGGLAHGISDAAASAAHGVAATATRIGTQTSETAGSLVHQAADAAGHLGHQVSDAAGQLSHQASETAGRLAHQAQDAAGYVADGARTHARRLEQGFQTTMKSNPVALGAAALAVGAAFGFALPRTRKEDELMGAVSDDVVHRAQDAAAEALQTVQHVSEQTAQKATGALRDAMR